MIEACEGAPSVALQMSSQKLSRMHVGSPIILISECRGLMTCITVTTLHEAVGRYLIPVHVLQSPLMVVGAEFRA